MFDHVPLPRNKIQKGLQLLKYCFYQNFQRTKLLKNIILRNFCYITFSQKVNIKRDIQNLLVWAPNKPPFLRKLLKIHIAYTLRQNIPVLHTEFHGNRFSRSPVMPAQTDRHTDKKEFKKCDFSFSAHLIIHVGIIYLKKI